MANRIAAKARAAEIGNKDIIQMKVAKVEAKEKLMQATKYSPVYLAPKLVSNNVPTNLTVVNSPSIRSFAL